MAFMIPENLATRGDIPSRLGSVAAALRDGLDDSVTVWLEESGDGEDPYLLVLDPRLGILLVDFLKTTRGFGKKGGLFARRLSAPSDNELLTRLDAVKDRLGEEVGTENRLGDLPVVTTVAIPDRDRKGALNLGFTEEDLEGILTQSDFRQGRLLAAVNRVLNSKGILPKSSNGGVTETEEKVVRGLLHPEVVIDCLWNEDDGEDGQLVFRPPETNGEDPIRVLDREQERLARHLGEGYRVIRGVAGSGKTLVLTFRAKLLAEMFPQWRILLTCFNICLQKSLAHQFKDLPNVDVVGIDSYASKLLHEAGKRISGGKSEDFTKRRQAAAALLDDRPELRRYDVVLVDEGQDFDGPAFDLAYNSLKQGRDQFVVALDAAQNIYRKRMRWNPPGQTARGRTKVLQVNYRNTKEILEFAFGFLEAGGGLGSGDGQLDDPTVVVRPEATSRRGPRPMVIVKADPGAEIRTIVELIEQRLDEGVVAGDMLVLLGHPKPWQFQLYGEFMRRGLPYFWVTKNRYSKLEIMEHGDCVRASNIHTIKGLEFSRVFMCGLNGIKECDDSEESLRRLVYTGMTRAMDELVVTVSGSGPIGKAVQAAQ